jgi:hypothetical protein
VKPEQLTTFKYFKQCRDLNAGAFHTVLASFLSTAGAAANGGPEGFVMDITTADEVWNHAIYSFQSKVGQPTPLFADGEADPFEFWRARGTVSIVDVYTTVTYAVENGPRVLYTPREEATKVHAMHYTLELDAAGQVIGGEWHAGKAGEPQSGAALIASLKAEVEAGQLGGTNTPDFVWGFKKGTFVADGKIIKAAFVKKIYDCSRAATPSGTHTVRGKTFTYVECGP